MHIGPEKISTSPEKKGESGVDSACRRGVDSAQVAHQPPDAARDVADIHHEVVGLNALEGSVLRRTLPKRRHPEHGSRCGVALAQRCDGLATADGAASYREAGTSGRRVAREAAWAPSHEAGATASLDPDRSTAGLPAAMRAWV